MKDLISRQAAIKAIEDLPNCYNGFSDTYDKACIIGALEELPPTDAVKVVRCKDCRWYKKNYLWDGKEVKICVKEPFEPVRKNNDFCSYGEKHDG